MDATVDDDICILNHEKADFARRQDQEIPFSASSGEESVASHFALITAYEDIKKRLKETERDNYSLKKRLRILEEKLCETNPEELNMVKCKPVNEVWSSREQLNKAFIAYREVCIERDRLKSKVDILEKEKAESKKTLYQQLESKEMELLQVESELETQKVMRCLDKTPTDWEIEKQNSDLKLRTMEQELELLQNEYQLLKAELQSTKDQAVEKPLFSNENYRDDNSISDSDIRQAFRELKKEMSNLHLVTKVQAEVLRKLKATVTVTKKASHGGPVQCEEDLEKSCSRLRITPYEKPFTLPKEHNSSGAQAPQQQGNRTALQKAECITWTTDRPLSVGSTDSKENYLLQKSSFEENSWVIPSPPKICETLFWERKNDFPTDYPVHYQYDRQNYMHKS